MRAETLSHDTPDPDARITAHVALKLHIRRRLLGLTLEQVADAVGVAPQQVQKYERGLNRISASKLFHLARALGVLVSYFYEDLPSADQASAGQASADIGDGFVDFLRADDAPALIAAINRIQVRSTRRRLLALVEAIAAEQP